MPSPTPTPDMPFGPVTNGTSGGALIFGLIVIVVFTVAILAYRNNGGQSDGWR